MAPTLSHTVDLQAIHEKLSRDPEWEGVSLPPIDLPEEDGVPLEDVWHRNQMNLLIDCVKTDKTGKEDFFTGGNMFIYYMLEQVEKTGYKGPDFFYVKDVDPYPYRGKWVVWLEGGKYPDVIIELLSPSTRKNDLTKKKELYEKTFKTMEYYCFDHSEPRLYGWRLKDGEYTEILSDEKGYMDSLQLGYKLGIWNGKYLDQDTFLRFFNENYELIPTHAELAHSQALEEQQRAEREHSRAELEKERANSEFFRAEQEKQRAEQEKQRAEQEKQRAEQEKQRAEQEKQRAEQLEQELLELKKRLSN